jgi:predicted DCC family thiol-disulfide oxidoreductase YuxK
MPGKRPTFVFDGDCGICRTWVDYWRRLTGDAVVYRPYQEAAGDFPAIPAAEFRRASQLIEPDGTVLAGAAATFKLLTYARGRALWWWLYAHVPGFAPLSEAAYAFLSTRRGLLARLTHLLWGRNLEPESYALVAWLFLRGLGLVYLAAFLSLALQIRGLVGADGILPLGEYLTAAHQGWGSAAYWRLPTLFWLNHSDAALIAGAWTGVALAVPLTLGIPRPSIAVSNPTSPSPLTGEGWGGGGASSRMSVDTPHPDPPPRPCGAWLRHDGGRESKTRSSRRLLEIIRTGNALAQRAALVALFVLYLSFVYAGQMFLNYQWDMLLVETGFLAIFLTGGSALIVWLYRLLLFRFLFLAGLVKLASGDPTWQQLTALDYHFFTQPLPSPLAWYAAQLPHWLLAAGTAMALVIELVAVVLIFLPRRPRMLAAALVIPFQLCIMLTGSYNWFNLLTVLLCLFLLDDQALRRVLPRRLAARVAAPAPAPGRLAAVAASVLALLVVPVGLNLIYAPLAGRNLPLAGALTEAVAPLLIVNPYGLFATTTTTRPVIAIEGSNDNKTWREYALPYLPGPVTRAPRWSLPYQPRLDWQLWFAAYGGAAQNRWIERLLLRVLEDSPAVMPLFAADPFAPRPPRYVRALLYDYRFAPAAGHGAWWVRRLEGTYYPAATLDDLRRTAP